MTFRNQFRFSFAALIVFVAVFATGSVRATALLQVAAAADLACCIESINRAFEKTANVAVKTSIGSSGNFYAQIRNGAPFDVFLSADLFYPETLAAQGYADRSSMSVYAIGTLAILASDRRFAPERGLAALSDPAVTRIAIANPDVAPYGRAAKAALIRAGLWERLQPKLVRGENVAQAAQFVRSGNAQLGFVSAAHLEDAQSAWTVPAELHPPIEQGGIVTEKGRANPLAQQYLDFIRSETAQAVLRANGFRFPAK